MSGFPKSACARSTFIFSFAGSSDIFLLWISTGIPRPFKRVAAPDSASQPSIAANSASSSLALMPSSSVKSAFAYISSFSFIIA